MRRLTGLSAAFLAVLAISTSGCKSPHRADQGALLGGVGGGVLGAVVGKQMGHTGAGAAIGAMTGLVAGSVIGNEIDEVEAQNRAQIEAQLGRQVTAGAVSIGDVISMSAAGIDEAVITEHIQYHGVVGPLTPDDLITLKNAGVSSRVVMVMQEPPERPVTTTKVVPVSRPVIIHREPWCAPRRHHYIHHYDHHDDHHYGHHDRHHPRAGVHFSFGH